MANDDKESNVETQCCIQNSTETHEDKSVHDIGDLGDHIRSSLSTAGLTGQMLVDEVFKGFLAKKLGDIESGHQKVHKSKKKKSKDSESSKSRKHKHKKKHKNKGNDEKVDVDDVDRKGHRHSHSKSDEQKPKHKKERNVEDKICENEYDQQRDVFIKSNNCGDISLVGSSAKEEMIEGRSVEEYEQNERKCDAMLGTSIPFEIAGSQMLCFAESEDGVTSCKTDCNNDNIDLKPGLCSDLSLSVHHLNLSKSHQANEISSGIQNCGYSEMSYNDEKTVHISECNVDDKDTIVLKGIDDISSMTGIRNKEESSILHTNVALDIKNLPDSKKDKIPRNELSACEDQSVDHSLDQNQGRGHRSDHRSFGSECRKAEKRDVLKTSGIADLCLPGSSNIFVGDPIIIDSSCDNRSDDNSKRSESCRKKEADRARSSEKRPDVDKSKKHSHSKREKIKSVERDRESKDYASSRDHSKDHSTDIKCKITSKRSSHAENKPRDVGCRSKEQQRTRSTERKSVERRSVERRSVESRSAERRSDERRHSSRRKSRERDAEKSDCGSRHKSSRRKHKSDREKSVVIIEDEEAESADASDKLTERLLKRLNTTIKKGQEIKAEMHSHLESHTFQPIDEIKPILCSQTESSLIIPESQGQSLSEPIVLEPVVAGKDLASVADSCPVNPCGVPVPSVSAESVAASTVRPTLSKAKKPAMKMGIRLTESSFAIISSGVRFESELKDVSGIQGEENGGSEPNAKELPKVSVLSNSEDVITDKHLTTSSAVTDKAKENTVCPKQEGNDKIELDVHDEKKSKKRKHSRSRSRSRGHSGKKSRRERSAERCRGSLKSRSKDRNRRSEDSNRRPTSRSRGRDHRSRSVSRDRSRRAKARSRNHDHRSGSRSRDQKSSTDSRHRKRSRSQSAEPKKPEQDLRLKIDKAKLREIAIKNVFGTLPSGSRPLGDLKPEAATALKAGGKSVEELTDFCKRIAEKEKNQLAESPLLEADKELTDDEDKPFPTNTLKARDLVSSIVLNIRNSKPLQVLTSQEKLAKAAELRTQFPVSSGSQHRDKEWVPVETPKPGESSETSDKKDVKVFPDPPSEQIDVSHIVSERLSALRKLQSNPSDVQALGCVYKSQQKIQQWAASKQLPGLFMGSTGVNILSQKELMGNNPKNQAWVKKVSS